LQHLTSLSLSLGESQIKDLRALEQFKDHLTSLSLNLEHSRIADLQGLGSLKYLMSLSLILDASPWDKDLNSPITDLKELNKFEGLTSLHLLIPSSMVPEAAHLKVPQEVITLRIVLREDILPDIPTGYKFVDLTVSR
jgi:hypothetical protein